jgi:hypothetical protein
MYYWSASQKNIFPQIEKRELTVQQTMTTPLPCSPRVFAKDEIWCSLPPSPLDLQHNHFTIGALSPAQHPGRIRPSLSHP